MEFRLLGPIEVVDAGRPVPLGGPRQRAVLAALALEAGRVVPVERLGDAIWGQVPPATAERQVRTCVWALRQALGSVIVTAPPGYRLVADGEQVDVLVFDRRAAQGSALAAQGRVGQAAERFRSALALWRGPALGGAPGLTAAAARLEERRLSVLEARIEADLRCGHHAELVGELSGLVAEHPLRERLWGQLILALYRSGRQADALGAYRALHARLVEEVGIEPGPSLQQLHRRILAVDPALDAPAAPARGPRQLPADVATFIGRELERAHLTGLLGGAGQRDRMVVAAIAGQAGVGKSALAVHAAHRVSDRFPDGQLYVNLQGATAGLAPLDPLQVLDRFLRALGVDGGEVPARMDDAAATFRSQVAGLRLLVVLDNARDAAQVEPLLPGTPGCAVLVTSRRMLAELPGATHLHLGTLHRLEAVALLGRLIGQRRVAAEAQAATAVARCCGDLPLALQIAGGRLAARPDWPVEELATRLADTRRRLDELELATIGVRTSFQVSYEELRASADPRDRAAATAFGLLGVLDSPDAGIAVAARLLDRPEREVAPVLERLVDAQLLETPTPGRYRLHDMLRLYARERAGGRHAPTDLAAALARAFGFYVATTWSTMALLRPGDRRLARADPRWAHGGRQFDTAAAALAWLESERANLGAAVRQAAATDGCGELALQLTEALFGLYWVHSHWREWVAANRVAIQVARRLGDRAALAQARNDLGVARWRQGRYHLARASLRRGLAIRRELGDRHGQASSLGNLGLVHLWQGRFDEALDCLQPNLAIFAELGDRHGQVNTLGNLAIAYAQQSRYGQALDCLHEALAAHRQLGDRQGEARALSNLGIVYQRQQRYQQALECQRQALAIHEQLGDRWGLSESLANLGLVYREQRQYQRALGYQQQALAIRRELGDHHSHATSLRDLGVTLWELGHTSQAQDHWRQALALFERLGTPDAGDVRAFLARQPFDRS